MTKVELSIKGDVAVMRLQPDDVIVVETGNRLSAEMASVLKKQAEEAFPGHKVVIASNVKISLTREEVAA